MKILHIYKDCFPIVGGIENHIKDLAVAQVAAGHEVKVLVTNPGGQPAQSTLEGVLFIRASRLATVASTPLSISLPIHLRREKTDITHLHFPYPLGEISQLVLGRGRPYVIGYHSDVVKQQTILRIYRPFLRRVLHGASRIVVSNDNYVHSSPYLRPFAAKCETVPYSVDAQRFVGAKPLIEPVDYPSLIFVGRHRYYKGLDDLLRAMPHIRGRLLVGGDGPMRPSWETLVQDLDLKDRVLFLGDISDDDLPRLYASGDIFVLPANSRAEAFGLVLQEAMAAGLPCVTTDLGTGTSYVVQDGISGLVVPPRRPDLLADAINSLLKNPDRRRKMGATGQERVRREFTLEQMTSQVEKIYHQAITSSDRKKNQ